MKLNERVGVMEYINEFNVVNSQLVFVYIEFDKEVKRLVGVVGSPSPGDRFVRTVSNSHGKNKLKIRC